MDIFGDAPQEDPEAARLRKQAERRAEADRISSIQDQLSLETSVRQRRGLSSLLGPFSGLKSLLGSG